MSIQSMRDNSDGVVAKVIVGLIIIVFALFGMGSITTFLAPVPKAATVNGADITQQEMEIEVERNRRIQIAQGRDPSTIDEDQLRATVLENLINRKLLTVAAEDWGLSYSESKLDQEIVSTEVFQVDGVYNPEQFRLILNSAGFTPTGYRAEMRRDKMLAQMNKGIAGSAFLAPQEIARASSLSQQTRDIAYLRVRISDLVDDIDVPESDIQAYYESNPEQFMTEETVDIAYIEIRRSDLLDDVVIDEDELLAFYEDTKAIYAEPERRRLAHILVEVNDEVSTEDAKAKIEEIYSKVTSGEDFATLAEEYSDDTGSAEVGGDLGFNEAGTFVEEFEEAGNALSLNQISEPVETEFGFHLIKLLDIEPAKEPTFAEVRARVEDEYREVQAETMFVNLSSQLSEISYESSDLSEPAEELGLEISHTGLVSRSAETGLAANPSVIAAAFSSEVLLDGNNSNLLEITPNHHVVIRVASHQPRELKPIEAVTEEIASLLKEEQAREIAEAQAKDMVDMLASGSITRFVADKYGLEWTVVPNAGRNSAGIDRQINTEAFSLPRPSEGNKSVGYATLANGDTAVISVTNVVNKEEDATELAGLQSLARVLAAREGATDYQELRDQLAADGDVDSDG